MLKVLTLTGGIRLQQCPVLLTHNHLQTIDGLPSSRAIQIGLPNLQKQLNIHIILLYAASLQMLYQPVWQLPTSVYPYS